MTSRTVACDWEDARRIAHAAVSPLGSEVVPLASAIGRVASRDIRAALDIPHYASSAMDGWAVRGAGPWMASDGDEMADGGATPIVTGGVIPRGADRIVRAEHALRTGATVVLAPGVHSPGVGADIRPAAQEARAGDVVVSARTVLNPAHIAVAASCAVDSVEVVRRPRVAVLLTGDEVIESGLPLAGQVRDSFGPQLPAVIGMLGGDVVGSRRVADRRTATVEALLEAREGTELVVTTGGTGVSSSDHLRAALEQLDAEFVIPRLAVRPGGPGFLARMPDGTLVVGLAGNPLAALVGLLLLAEPLITAWSGREASTPTMATTGHDIAGNARSTQLLPYRRLGDRAVPSAWIGAGMMRGLAEAEGLLVIPQDGLSEGSPARAILLPWPTG